MMATDFIVHPCLRLVGSLRRATCQTLASMGDEFDDRIDLLAG